MVSWLRARGSHAGSVGNGSDTARILDLGEHGGHRLELVVLGAHGGSGATTLARFLGGDAEDVGQVLPTSVDPGVVVVAALGTAYGARLAIERAAEVAVRTEGVVVAVTADGPWPTPVAVRARLRALEANVLAVVPVPYVARWRFVDSPDAPPARYLEAVRTIRSAVTMSNAKSNP